MPRLGLLRDADGDRPGGDARGDRGVARKTLVELEDRDVRLRLEAARSTPDGEAPSRIRPWNSEQPTAGRLRGRASVGEGREGARRGARAGGGRRARQRGEIVLKATATCAARPALAATSSRFTSSVRPPLRSCRNESTNGVTAWPLMLSA